MQPYSTDPFRIPLLWAHARWDQNIPVHELYLTTRTNPTCPPSSFGITTCLVNSHGSAVPPFAHNPACRGFCAVTDEGETHTLIFAPSLCLNPPPNMVSAQEPTGSRACGKSRARTASPGEHPWVRKRLRTARQIAMLGTTRNRRSSCHTQSRVD